MSIDIIIRLGDEAVIVNGGVPSITDMINRIEGSIQEKYPDIHEAAFDALEFDQINLHKLSRDDFKKVYQVSKSHYEDVKKELPDEESRRRAGARWDNWQDYMAALESDPRLK